MSFLFGGGNQEAERRARISSQEQQVANNRQLAELNRGEQRAGLDRRSRRGRRLFADAGDNDLKGNLA